MPFPRSFPGNHLVDLDQGKRLLLGHPAALQFGFQAHLRRELLFASGLRLSYQKAIKRLFIVILT